MPPEQFRWWIDQLDGDALLRFRGDLDMAGKGDAEAALMVAEALPCERLVLDLRGVTFISCCGARVLVRAARRADRQGRGLLIDPGPKTERLLALLELTSRFEYRLA